MRMRGFIATSNLKSGRELCDCLLKKMQEKRYGQFYKVFAWKIAESENEVVLRPPSQSRASGEQGLCSSVSTAGSVRRAEQQIQGRREVLSPLLGKSSSWSVCSHSRVTSFHAFYLSFGVQIYFSVILIHQHCIALKLPQWKKVLLLWGKLVLHFTYVKVLFSLKLQTVHTAVSSGNSNS